MILHYIPSNTRIQTTPISLQCWHCWLNRTKQSNPAQTQAKVHNNCRWLKMRHELSRSKRRAYSCRTA